MRSCAATTPAFKGECGFCEFFDGGAIQLIGSGALHRFDELVRDGGDYEDLFFADAQQVIIEGRALNDALGGSIQIGGLVDDDGWIPGAARNHTLAGFARRLHNGGASGYA